MFVLTGSFCLVYSSKGPAIQSIALAATKSGVVAQDVQEIASMGNYGRSENHVATQMTRRFCESDELGVPQPYIVELPIQARSSEGWYMTSKPLGMFLPHEWFSWLENHKEASGFAHLEAFWEEHSADDPKLAGNPIVKEGRHHFLPMVLHGDGGQFHRGDSIHVISLRSLLSKANVASSQLLLIAIPKQCCHKSSAAHDDTMAQVWSIFKWSLNHMFFGKHPEVDHLGQPWPANSPRALKAGTALNTQGKCGWLFAVSCDGEYQMNELGLPGHAHNACCWMCGANKSTVPFNDFRPCAAWRKTKVLHKGKCPTSHQLGEVNGVTGDTFALDTLHVMDEGVISHTLGNVVFDFICKPGWPGTVDQKLKSLFDKVCQQYLEQSIEASHRIKRLVLSSFTNPKSKYEVFPDMSGIKAKQLRWLLPVLYEICVTELGKATDAYNKHKLACLYNLNKVYTIIDEQGLHMDRKAHKSLLKSMNLFLVHYTTLSSLSIEQGYLQWNTIHKHHLSTHLAEQSEWVNPRFVATYQGETMVGFMSALAHQCLSGTPSHQVPLKVCWRFRLGLHLRLTGGNLDLMSDEEDSN